MERLRGKRAIVTGASRGLGVHIARTLARQGVDLVLAARSTEQLDQTRRSCEAYGVRVIVVACDVTSTEDLQRLVATAEREFGAIDILVNNAGIELIAPFNEMSIGQVDNLIRTNLSAPVELTRMVLPSMLARNSGAVVQIASLAGKAPVPFDSMYATTKAGLVNFAESLHAELEGTGVRSSVVCPGFVSGEGMWADREAAGASKPFTLGTVTPERVAKAVLKALRGHPEVIVAAGPMRPLLAMGSIAPRLRVTMARRLGLAKTMREEAAMYRLGQGGGKGEEEAAGSIS